MTRFSADAILEFATRVLGQAGASHQIAAATAKYLLEGDLLGYRTHGLKRLYFNAKLLQSGAALGSGEIEILSQRAAVASWDAHFLPGPFVASQAVEKAAAMAREAGSGTIIVRRAQHVASLAAYLQIATSQGLYVSLMCSTPAQASVAPYGGCQPVFSPNPFAMGVPTSTQPVLLDMSFSMTAAGKVRQFWERSERLPWNALITDEGKLTDDPKAYIEQQQAAILPLGGADLGYKGYGLCLFSELWTMALSNYGRIQGAGDGESNTLWVHVLDPVAFGDPQQAREVADDLLKRCQQSKAIDPANPVRIPGQRALAQKAEQLVQGVWFDQATVGRLQRAAERFATPLPQSLPD